MTVTLDAADVARPGHVVDVDDITIKEQAQQLPVERRDESGAVSTGNEFSHVVKVRLRGRSVQRTRSPWNDRTVSDCLRGLDTAGQQSPGVHCVTRYHLSRRDSAAAREVRACGRLRARLEDSVECIAAAAAADYVGDENEEHRCGGKLEWLRQCSMWKDSWHT